MICACLTHHKRMCRCRSFIALSLIPHCWQSAHRNQMPNPSWILQYRVWTLLKRDEVLHSWKVEIKTLVNWMASFALQLITPGLFLLHISNIFWNLKVKKERTTSLYLGAGHLPHLKSALGDLCSIQVLVVHWLLVMPRKCFFEGLEFTMRSDNASRHTGEDRGSTKGSTGSHSNHSFH